uniref:Uncharacterized protein n=1 Tax=Anguilla anguilla TaxID=7936 RepID=A0A0E9X513_ANGAN
MKLSSLASDPETADIISVFFGMPECLHRVRMNIKGVPLQKPHQAALALTVFGMARL